MKIPGFMYNSTCSLYLRQGPTAKGDDFGSEIPDIKCRVELKIEKKTRDENGVVVEFVSKGTAFIDYEDVTEGSKIVYKGNEYIVASTEPAYGFTFSHSEVVLK